MFKKKGDEKKTMARQSAQMLLVRASTSGLANPLHIFFLEKRRITPVSQLTHHMPTHRSIIHD